MARGGLRLLLALCLVLAISGSGDGDAARVSGAQLCTPRPSPALLQPRQQWRAGLEVVADLAVRPLAVLGTTTRRCGSSGAACGLRVAAA